MTATGPDARLGRIPALLGTCAWIAFAGLSLCTNASTRFYQWPWFFYWQVLLVAPVALLAGRLLAGRRGLARFGGALDAGLGLLAAVNIVAALLSPFRPQSLTAALIPVATICLAYLTLDWLREDPARVTRLARWLGRLMALFVIVSFALWLQRVATATLPLGRALGIRNEQPLGHSVYTAGFAVLAAPWLAVLGLTARGGRRAGWLLAAGLALALVPTTASRGGAVAAAVALALAAALWLASARLGRAARWRIAAGALLAAGLLIGIDPRLRDLLVHGRWSDAASESNRQRSAMLEAGWLMGRDRPGIGYGPGTVSLVYPKYRDRLSGGVDNVLQLHSLPAQVWAELGLPGILAGLLVIAGAAGLARASWRVPADAPEAADRLRALALTVAGAGYAVMSLFDFQLDVPLFAATGALLLAAWRTSASAGRGGVPASVISRGWARALGPLLVAALAAMLWPTQAEVRARQLFAEGADARVAGDEAAFFAGAEAATAVTPWESYYLIQAGAAWGERWLQEGNDAGRAAAQAQCIALLQRALAINPNLEYCHSNLGWLLLPADPAAAETHLRAAARLSPDRGGVYFGIGFCRLARGDRAGAAHAFALECLNDPRALASPAWDSPPLTGFRAEVVDALHRITRQWLEAGVPPPATPDELRYVAALADWWTGRSADTTDLIRHGAPDQRQFFLEMPAVEARAYPAAPLPAVPAWVPLYRAWREGAAAAGPGSPAPDTTAAIRRLIARPHVSFAEVLTSRAGADPALVQFIRNQRPGESVLHRNQDGFPLSDLHSFPQNILVAASASFLFPRKGYLPSPILLDTLNHLVPAVP